MSSPSPWHSTFTDVLEEAIDIGWIYATQDGQLLVELATLIKGSVEGEQGAYILMGNQIVNAQGRVCARLAREKPQPRTARRRQRRVIPNLE